MASNLTAQVRNIAQVTTAVAQGDLTQKITVDAEGEILELKDTINTMVDQLRSFAAEVTRVAREVGTEGKLGGQAEVEGVGGHVARAHREREPDGGQPDRPGAQHRPGHHGGRQRRPVQEDHRRRQGRDAASSKNTINTMVDQLRSFAAEVTRVAREVGHRGQARRSGRGRRACRARGADLTENVNPMAGNLTDQVRNIAQVTTAVANGDLSQEDHRRRQGRDPGAQEHDQHDGRPARSFADEVTRVAREVGTEGKLGGQAQVEGVAGTWRDLTENVNQLAGNLTTQVRAIAEVSTAVTQGDLTRSITVEAQGEVAELKDNINQMIANLRETTQRNEEQDWLKTNLARSPA